MAKKKENEVDAIDYKQILLGKKIPLLTLDPRWHELFPEHMKTPAIKKAETQLNKLIQLQGKLTTDEKELLKLKKRLMDVIVTNMGDVDGANNPINKKLAKKQEKSQKLITDINVKLRENDMELTNIPNEIQEANKMLLIECMKVCYDKFRMNIQDIKQLDGTIEKMRALLKEKALLKQEKEMQNEGMYSYMHHLLGGEVMNLFDEKNAIEYK